MIKGGYKIINFKDVNIRTAGGATVPGIYDDIKKSNRKAIMVSGITIDAVEKPDCFVDCEVSGSDYKFSAYGKTFTITSENKVTFA